MVRRARSVQRVATAALDGSLICSPRRLPPSPPQLLSQLFTGLCNGTVASSIGIGRILIAAAALLLVQLCLITDVCCFHPGDASAWLTDEESSAVTPSAKVLQVAVVATSGNVVEMSPRASDEELRLAATGGLHGPLTLPPPLSRSQPVVRAGLGSGGQGRRRVRLESVTELETCV